MSTREEEKLKKSIEAQGTHKSIHSLHLHQNACTHSNNFSSSGSSSSKRKEDRMKEKPYRQSICSGFFFQTLLVFTTRHSPTFWMLKFFSFHLSVKTKFYTSISMLPSVCRFCLLSFHRVCACKCFYSSSSPPSSLSFSCFSLEKIYVHFSLHCCY